MKLDKIIVYSLGPFLSAFFGFITIPIIAWLFEPHIVGQLSIFNILIGFSTLFFTLGLDYYLIRNYHHISNKENVLYKVMFTSVFFTILMLIFIGLFFYYGYELYLPFGEVSIWVYLMVAVAIVVVVISRFLSLKLRLDDNAKAYSLYLFLVKFNILFFLLVFYFFYGVESFENLMLIHLLAIIASFLFLLYFNRTSICFNIKLDFELSRRAILFGFPMVISGVAYWGLTAVDRLLIERFLNLESLAVYSVGVSIASIAVILQSIFSTVWIVDIYKRADDKPFLIKNISQTLLMISELTIILYTLFVMSLPIIEFIVPPKYSDAISIMPIAFLSPLFFIIAEVGVVGLGIVKKTKIIMLITVLVFCINFFLNYILIPIYGLVGAATSTLICFGLLAFLRIELSCYFWAKFDRLYVYSIMIFLICLSFLNYIIPDSEAIYLYYFHFPFFLLYSLYLLNKYKSLGFITNLRGRFERRKVKK